MPFLGARGQASRGYFGGGTTPDAPTSLVATRGDTEISVAFSAPVFNGGLDITNYEYSLNAGSTWTAISPVDAASPVIITGLSNGTAYTVYLRAVNAIGAGTTSGPANAVTPAGVPGAPGIPTATTCQNLQSALTWTAANNNGAAVTDYVVEYSTSATFASAVTVFADGTSASTTATVTGLTNGTTYYFRVKATNAVGTGTYSGISTATTPATVPGAPTSVVGTSNTNGQSSVSWVAPASNGGDAVASYTVEYSTSSTFASAVTVVSPVSTSSPKVVTGLTNGTTYYFRVKANNCAGSGAYSTISAGAVPATAPSAPVIGTSTTSDRSVTINWTASASTGGAAVTYTVELWNSATGWDVSTTTTSTSQQFTARNDRGYIGRVTAYNSAGTSAVSGNSAQVYPAMVIPTISWEDTSPTKYSLFRASFTGNTNYTYQTQLYPADLSGWADYGATATGSGTKYTPYYNPSANTTFYFRVKVYDPDGVYGGVTNQISVTNGNAAVYSVAGWGSESANKTYTQTVSTPVGVGGATYANGSSNGQGATEWGNATAISVVSTNQGTDRRVISVKIDANKVSGQSGSLTSSTRRLAVNLNGTVTRETVFDSFSVPEEWNAGHTLSFADSNNDGADGDRTAYYGMRDTTTTWQSSTGTWRYSDNANNFWASSRTTFVMTVTYRDRTWAPSVETTAAQDSVYG